MSFYGSMKPRHVKAENEEKLEKKLAVIQAMHEDSMLKMINIYRAGNSVVAWYYHDFSKAGAPPKEVTKKKSNKEESKKKGR